MDITNRLENFQKAYIMDKVAHCKAISGPAATPTPAGATTIEPYD